MPKEKGVGGRPPSVIANLTNEEMVELGEKNFNAQEEDVLRELGVKPKYFRTVRFNRRWREHFDRGKSIGNNKFNATLAESGDATIRREIAKRTMPEVDIIEEGYQFEIDCSPQFRKGISK